MMGFVEATSTFWGFVLPVFGGLCLIMIVPLYIILMCNFTRRHLYHYVSGLYEERRRKTKLIRAAMWLGAAVLAVIIPPLWVTFPWAVVFA